MQNTRLNNLVDTLAVQISGWLRNPWRRLSIIVISLLFGFFLGTAIPTTSGQRATWDVFSALILVLFTEAVSWFVYGNHRRSPSAAAREPNRADSSTRSLLAEMLNALKIGLTYGLFVEAFKLGS
jgi:hypothetical protein